MFYADRNVRPCTILGYTLTTFPKSLIQTKTTKTSTELRAVEGPCTMLDVTFKDFYMCVSLIYKDELQDNYSILKDFLMNCTQIIIFK